jgi:phosphoribosylformylglycinamidine synthase I
MTAPRAVVIAGPGTNRDHAAVRALTLAGAQAEVVTSTALLDAPELLASAQIALIAGGFSHADALGAGRMLALELTRGADGRVAETLHRFVDRGGAMLGICNGFQVLVRSGLLPGALGHNDSGRFQCEWVSLEVVDSVCVWTRGLSDADGDARVIDCPIAHGEGRYVHPDPDALAASGQVALRYASANPNGSVADIAGVCDETGRVLGLMPHPEDHVLVEQHPLSHRRGTARGGLGLEVFRAGVRAVMS